MQIAGAGASEWFLKLYEWNQSSDFVLLASPVAAAAASGVGVAAVARPNFLSTSKCSLL